MNTFAKYFYIANASEVNSKAWILNSTFYIKYTWCGSSLFLGRTFRFAPENKQFTKFCFD